MDLKHPISSTGLTPTSTYAFYLIFIDAYSCHVQFYGLSYKSCVKVISALKQYQADNIPVTFYGYLDLKNIRIWGTLQE